jgi:hypothetical protein
VTKTNTETGSTKRTADAPSGDDLQAGAETELLVWNGLVARAERAVCAHIPERDHQAETDVVARECSG